MEAILVKHLKCTLGYLKHYWPLAAGAFISLLVSSAAQLVIPRLTQAIIDQGGRNGSTKS